MILISLQKSETVVYRIADGSGNFKSHRRFREWNICPEKISGSIGCG